MTASTSPCQIPGIIKLPQQITRSRRNVLHHGKPQVFNLGKLVEDALKVNREDQVKKINSQSKGLNRFAKKSSYHKNLKEKSKIKVDRDTHPKRPIIPKDFSRKKKLSPLKKLVLQERKKKETSIAANSHSITNEDAQSSPVLIETLAELMSKMIVKHGITVSTQLNTKINEQRNGGLISFNEEQKLVSPQTKKKKVGGVKKRSGPKMPQAPNRGGPALKSLAEFLTVDSTKILHSNPNSIRPAPPSRHRVIKKASADREKPLDPSLAEANRLNLIKRRALALPPQPEGVALISCDAERMHNHDHTLVESYLIEHYDHVRAQLIADDLLTAPPSLALAPQGTPPHPPTTLAISCWRAFLLRCCARVKENVHTKKFRGYCNNYPDPDVTRGVKDLLTTLLNFYRRKLEENQEKARNPEKKRSVFGLKEILKLMGVGKVKCVVMATDIEPVPTPGGLDQLVKSVIDNAKNKNVPVVYGIRRDALSRLYNRRINISAVGILNYQGAEVKYRQLMSFVEASRIRYRDDFCAALVDQIKIQLKNK